MNDRAIYAGLFVAGLLVAALGGAVLSRLGAPLEPRPSLREGPPPARASDRPAESLRAAVPPAGANRAAPPPVESSVPALAFDPGAVASAATMTPPQADPSVEAGGQLTGARLGDPVPGAPRVSEYDTRLDARALPAPNREGAADARGGASLGAGRARAPGSGATIGVAAVPAVGEAAAVRSMGKPQDLRLVRLPQENAPAPASAPSLTPSTSAMPPSDSAVNETRPTKQEPVQTSDMSAAMAVQDRSSASVRRDESRHGWIPATASPRSLPLAGGHAGLSKAEDSTVQANPHMPQPAPGWGPRQTGVAIKSLPQISNGPRWALEVAVPEGGKEAEPLVVDRANTSGGAPLGPPVALIGGFRAERRQLPDTTPVRDSAVWPETATSARAPAPAIVGAAHYQPAQAGGHQAGGYLSPERSIAARIAPSLPHGPTGNDHTGGLPMGGQTAGGPVVTRSDDLAPSPGVASSVPVAPLGVHAAVDAIAASPQSLFVTRLAGASRLESRVAAVAPGESTRVADHGRMRDAGSAVPARASGRIGLEAGVRSLPLSRSMQMHTARAPESQAFGPPATDIPGSRSTEDPMQAVPGRSANEPGAVRPQSDRGPMPAQDVLPPAGMPPDPPARTGPGRSDAGDGSSARWSRRGQSGAGSLTDRVVDQVPGGTGYLVRQGVPSRAAESVTSGRHPRVPQDKNAQPAAPRTAGAEEIVVIYGTPVQSGALGPGPRLIRIGPPSVDDGNTAIRIIQPRPH